MGCVLGLYCNVVKTAYATEADRSISCAISLLGVPLVGKLRTRLLALHVLEAVLPACESGVEDDQMAQVLILWREFSMVAEWHLHLCLQQPPQVHLSPVHQTLPSPKQD